MFFRENRLTREVAWAGTGLQAWLQILTYVSKMEDYDTIILDEPEVFLHSDIQRRLIRLLRERVKQVILTTHSVDIINEAAVDQIVVVDKAKHSARRLVNLEALQGVLSLLGSVQNAHLLRAFRADLTLIVEGQDRRFLLKWFEKLGEGAVFDSPKLSVIPVGGFSGIDRLGDLKFISKSVVGLPIRAFALLDRDFMDDAQVAELREELKRRGLGSHVWDRKEIENYVLDPEVIALYLQESGKKKSEEEITAATIRTRLLAFAEELKPDLESQLFKRAQELAPKSEDPSTTYKAFQEAFASNWTEPEYRLSRISGKGLLSRLSAWSQSEVGVGLTGERLIAATPPESIPAEVRRLVRRLTQTVSEAGT